MAIENYGQLNEMHFDILREIGNIGAGNAATALSSLLSRTVDKGISDVCILDVNDAAERLGGSDKVVIAIIAKLSGDVDAVVSFIVDQAFSSAALKTMLGVENPPYENLSPLELSAIEELGNIILSSYVGAIATLAQLNIKISVPAVAVDMVGALLSVPMLEMESVSNQTIFIEDDFLSDEQSVTSNIMLVPSMDTLNIIMEGLGIGI